MTTTQTTFPDSDLSGAWELVEPLPVDGTSYTEPNLLGVATGAYVLGDGGADAYAPSALTLPDVPVAVGGIQLVAVGEEAYDSSIVGTSFPMTLPNVTIEAGDLIEIYTMSVETAANDLGPPNTPAGYTFAWSKSDGTDYSIRISLFYKIAAGGESGDVTFTFPSQHRLHCGIHIWRNVDQANPYDVTETVSYGHPDPDPPSLTTVTPNAVVQIITGGNIFGGTPVNSAPAGYTLLLDQSPDGRSFYNMSKEVATPGTEDPEAFDWGVQNSTSVMVALRPAGQAVTAVVVTAVTDETGTAEVAGGSGPMIAAANEVQDLTSTMTSGTFTITYSGQTTSALDWDSTAAEIETALLALSNLSSGDVTCTGGPLNVTTVSLEFGGTLANVNVPLVESSDSDVTVTELVIGSAFEIFGFEGSINIPFAAAGQPQLHVWSLDIASYAAGKKIDVTVADHDSLKSWAAALFVFEGVDASTIVENFGAWDRGGPAQSAAFGAITPSTSGAVVLALVAKALSTGNYSGSAGLPNPPSGYSAEVEAVADSMTLSGFLSPPVSAVATTPSDVSWTSNSELWALGTVSIAPETPASSGSDLYAVVNSQSETSWVEIAGAAGSMYEVLELDLAGIPADAVITGASFDFAHQCSVRNKLRAVMVGINSDDTISPGAEMQTGYVAEPPGSVATISTGLWSSFSDGSLIGEYSRLGVAFFSTEAHPSLVSHRLYWVEATIQYEEGGPVVTSVTGPASAADPVVWAYSSGSGLQQAQYQVMIIQGASQDPATATAPANPLDPAVGEIVYDSGEVSSSLARSLLIENAPLSRGDCTAAVRAWARLQSGELLVSPWATDDFNISGSEPVSGAQTTDPYLNLDDGGGRVTLDVPAGVTRAWLVRSTDSGLTWNLVEDGPYPVAASTTEIVVDYRPPLPSTILYQVSFDNGVMSESSDPVAVGTAASFTPVDELGIGRWYLQAPSDPSLNTRVDIAAVSIERPKRVVVAQDENGAVVAQSAPLSTRIKTTIRTKDYAERAAVDALLDSGVTLRLVDVFGRAWLVRPTTDLGQTILRWAPLLIESTGLRDAHTINVDFVQVAR